MARRVTRTVLDKFWLDIGRISASPFQQSMGTGGYNERAKSNRERIRIAQAREQKTIAKLTP
jgi:hypothetical protein